MSARNETIEEELRTLDFKLGQLRRDYEQYFLGNRPREPVLLRAEVTKTVVRLSNTAIKNTALRFRFSSLCSRFQACRRQWDETLRKIETGTYERHRFRAKIKEEAQAEAESGKQRAPDDPPPPEADLFQSYVEARLANGEDVEGFTRKKLERVLAKQRRQLAARLGADAEVEFRVAVEDGRVKLKASAKRASA